ncbi:hypothetical protein HPB47_018985 [Ixodes persulcatus]|uniref:Uncharacterized protein n=1 Tax=Ixodes persulcatus TaxID=34615 RepID=A0AC60QJC9_IXOPE|nr:hypothetical protein HPB47_018985 [Ixodes persulcatus]
MSHVEDVLYVFGRPVVEKASSDDQNYSKKLMELWTSFAKHGHRAPRMSSAAFGTLTTTFASHPWPRSDALSFGELLRLLVTPAVTAGPLKFSDALAGPSTLPRRRSVGLRPPQASFSGSLSHLATARLWAPSDGP